MRITAILLSLCLTFLTTACTKEKPSISSENQSHIDDHEEIHTTSGDIQEETNDKETLPRFLSEKEENIQSIYLAVAQNKKLLESLPCYCGCGTEANHKNNYDCFISENKENGHIVWDDHGTKCGVCLEIAAQSILDLNDGRTTEKIRAKVDEKYKNGYAKPTPTPQI